ncbi:hypothetical protein D3C87_1455070 [compost metagenome]
MRGDPVVDDLPQAHETGIFADGPQVPEPAERMQTDREFKRRQIDFKRRFAFGIEHAAGQRKTALEDFFGNEGIDSPEVRRRDDQAVGRRTGKAQRRDAADRKPARHAAPTFTRIQIGKPSPAGKHHQRPPVSSFLKQTARDERTGCVGFAPVSLTQRCPKIPLRLSGRAPCAVSKNAGASLAVRKDARRSA